MWGLSQTPGSPQVWFSPSPRTACHEPAAHPSSQQPPPRVPQRRWAPSWAPLGCPTGTVVPRDGTGAPWHPPAPRASAPCPLLQAEPPGTPWMKPPRSHPSRYPAPGGCAPAWGPAGPCRGPCRCPRGACLTAPSVHPRLLQALPRGVPPRSREPLRTPVPASPRSWPPSSAPCWAPRWDGSSSTAWSGRWIRPSSG